MLLIEFIYNNLLECIGGFMMAVGFITIGDIICKWLSWRIRDENLGVGLVIISCLALLILFMAILKKLGPPFWIN